MTLQQLEYLKQFQKVESASLSKYFFNASQKQSKKQLICRWVSTGKKYPKMTAVWVEIY